MAPKGISSLIDSDMNDDSHFQNENTIDSVETNDGPTEVTKKKGGRPRGSKNRITKPRTTIKRPRANTKTSSKTTAGSKPTSKRKGLEEKTNNQAIAHGEVNGNTYHLDAENAVQRPDESEDELDSPKTVSTKSQGTRAMPKIQKKTTAAERKRRVDTEEIHEHEPCVVRQGSALVEESNVPPVPMSTKPATKKAKLNSGSPKEKSGSVRKEADRITQDPETSETQSGSQLPPSPRFAVKENRRAVPKRRTDAPIRRVGSASDTERSVGDPGLRRKLGDVTRKLENVDLKYRNLKETGVMEANANVEKLRKQCEVTTQASNELIAALKKELATQTTLAQDSRKHQRALQAREGEVANLRSNMTEISNNLSVAQNEIRSLQARLATSRSGPVHTESAPSKTPASAMKHQAQPRMVAVGSTEAAQAVRVAQLKEDLYSDLTGLLIRGVKKVDEGDLYDCLQTGRNGTLHFKLAVEEGDGKATSFEDTEFLYTPLLDKNRDRDLLAILPDYLTEEITFSREHAAKFYSRVVDALTKRRAEE